MQKIKKFKGKIKLYQRRHLVRNVNRLFDTISRNRMLEKLLKTRFFSILDVYESHYCLAGFKQMVNKNVLRFELSFVNLNPVFIKI